MLNMHDKTFREAPYVIANEEGAFTMEEIVEFVNISVLRSIPRWSRRAYNTVHGLHNIYANAIVLVVDEISEEKLDNDFKYHAFVDIIQLTQEYGIGKMIPLITTISSENVVDDIP